VAGLSVAIILAERNIESQVLESKRRFDGPTSGVRISVEGVRVLRFMKVGSIGEETERVDLRFNGLSASFTAPEQDASAIVATRLALHEKLMERARALGIFTGDYEFSRVLRPCRQQEIHAVCQPAEISWRLHKPKQFAALGCVSRAHRKRY
jgi:2-polyprenyl-6-methoxyphenol hydroxylase-like FAD-dependent oxidoreductase